MKQYLKILKSTFIGSLAMASVISLGYFLAGNANGAIIFLPIATAVGFLSYGLLGSVAWWFTHNYFFHEMNRFVFHVYSAGLGIVFIGFIFLSLAVLGFMNYGEVVAGVLLSVIGAVASIIAYWALYYRCAKSA
ncbi:MAG: hypothetical protein ACI86C_001540 [Candidatus Latescibacterota bacterium]|jgi:hypothetical protein